MSTATLPATCRPVTLASVPQPLKKLVKFARSEGWLLGYSGSHHLVLVGPLGQRVMFSGSGRMNGRRAMNYRADMRRAGVPGA